MSEESKKTPLPEVDAFLAMLVTICTQLDTSMTVTLTVGGTRVSGTMISGKEYFESLAETFSAAGDNFVASEIAEAARKIARDSYSEAVEDTPPHYVHMKDVSYAAGAPILDGRDGLLWRGRLSEISGFHMGAYSNAED